MRKTLLFAAMCLLMASCSSNINMSLPRGPEGLSAYRVWVEAVESGAIDWDEETDPSGYFRYLKGEDGMSAYDQWKEMVADGIENPHDPPNLWPKEENDENDFFRFLTGEDGADGGNTGGGGSGGPGKSAYDLWVEDVNSGLDNPHTPQQDEWPKDETSMDDFWRYLSGDGEQGVNTIVDPPGSPGIIVNPVSGKPNVIAQYTQKEYSEYVSTVDGSVTYQVYLADQTKAGVGVKVTDMPGMPGKTFTTLSDGTFKASRGDLPTSGNTESRYGSVKVDGVVSAKNTYVPQKVGVRLMIGRNNLATPMQVPELGGEDGNTLNGGVYVNVPVRAQRQMTSEGEWEDLPTWLGTVVSGSVHPYALTNDLTPTPNMSKPIPYRSHAVQDLRGVTVGVRRPTIAASWLMSDATQRSNYYLWEPGVTPEDFTMVIDNTNGLYGDTPHANAVIVTAPVNFHPLPKDLVMGSFNASDGADGSLSWTSGSFNTTTIDPAGRFAAKYLPYDMGSYVMYNPDATEIDNRCLAVVFQSGPTIVGTANKSSLESPDYTMTNQRVYVGSDVYLWTTSLLVAGPGKTTSIGTVVKDGDEFYIEPKAPFTFARIRIWEKKEDILP